MVEPIDGVFLVEDETGRDALCAAIEQADRIALDTEFHAERRFIPELMLVQIATGPDAVWLLDPRSVDPTPVATMLGGQELIVHGGEQDLRLLAALGASPTRLFDTQQAAGLLGVRYPERLSLLCAHFLDIPVDKSATLTDWSTRPLTPQQIRYAAEDARLLLPLAARQRSLLENLERLEWAFELGAEQCAKASRGPQPADILRTWEICSRLEDDALKVIAALQTWRFEQAQRRDQPMYYILPDGMLLDLARRRPASMRALAENRRLHPGLIKRHGRTILGCIKGAVSGPVPQSVPTLEDHQQARLLAVWAELLGAEMGIAPRLLLPDAMTVVRTGAAGVSGWRNICKPRLENFRTGREVITIDGSIKKPCLRLLN